MGLDITAASKIERIADVSEEDYGFIYVPTTPDEFSSRTDGVKPGMYKSAASFGFRAGSYSGYGEWRESLAQLAGYAAQPHKSSWDKHARSLHAAGAWNAKEGPFWELINFSDCEGCIGPKTAAKLAKDFADFQEKADEHEDEWFRGQYANWRRAFELASDEGAVSFH